MRIIPKTVRGKLGPQRHFPDDKEMPPSPNMTIINVLQPTIAKANHKNLFSQTHPMTATTKQ